MHHFRWLRIVQRLDPFKFWGLSTDACATDPRDSALLNHTEDGIFRNLFKAQSHAANDSLWKYCLEMIQKQHIKSFIMLERVMNEGSLENDKWPRIMHFCIWSLHDLLTIWNSWSGARKPPVGHWWWGCCWLILGRVATENAGVVSTMWQGF